MSSVGKWTAMAPGRINLIGEHTDYNQGWVLPMAIDRYTQVTAWPIENEDRLVFSSDHFPGTVHFSRDGAVCLSQATPPPWTRYFSGMVVEFSKLGVQLPGLKFQIESKVPLGGGLSSSAALEVALAMILQKISDRSLDHLDTALLCQRVEHHHVGVPCGLMDQMASLWGKAGCLMLIDCRSNHVQQVRMSDEVAVVVIDSQIKHELAQGHYRQRREQCEAACRIFGVSSLRDVNFDQLLQARSKMPETVFRRARHVITENARTLEVAALINDQQWHMAGERMYQSHQSMRDDYEVSTPEIDRLVEIAQTLGNSQGVYGSRMTGGGFGGCTISLVAANQAEEVLQTVIDRYATETGKRIAGFVTKPSDGAVAIEERAASKSLSVEAHF